ncbi:MAG: glycine zipper family protein [Pseudomonadota bacterium]
MTLTSHSRLLAVGALGVALLAGCASNQPIVDTRGVDPVTYQRDLADCEAHADQVKVGQKAATGAAAGAAVGAVIGAIFGGDMGTSAAAGGVHGSATGAWEGSKERRMVIRNCLRDRGYSVYN